MGKRLFTPNEHQTLAYNRPTRNRRDEVVRTSKCGRVVITTRHYDVPTVSTYYDVMVDGVVVSRDNSTLADAKFEALYTIDPEAADASL
jgi:hypothetical protein